MNTVTKIRQQGDPIETRDVAGQFLVRSARDGKTYHVTGGYEPRSQARGRDTMLTTRMRLEAEPAPPRPDLGSVANGTSVERILGAAQTIEEAGLLSSADVTELRRIVAKYGATSGARTSESGITSNDAARKAVADVRKGVDQISAINKTNAEFWEKRTDADESRILGR